MDEWDQRSKQSKLASVLYPGLTTEKTRAEMQDRAKGEGKRPPAATPLLDHVTRGALSPLGGRAKP